MQFFSDRERGEQAPTRGEFSIEIWEAIWAYVDARIDDGSFGKAFPDVCPDGSAAIGTDSNKFFSVARGMIPDFDPRLVRSWVEEGAAVPTLAILDFIEFCHAHVASPVQGRYHDFFKHYHLSFDRASGQSAFRDAVNTMLARNHLTFRLQETGEVQRTAPAEVVEDLRSATFATGDAALDKLLEQARTSYLSPHEDRRRSGLEKLWDAFERLKTLEDPDKKQGTKQILDRAAPGSTELRARLEDDARALTDIGNKLMIRHHETNKEPITKSEQVDYLFARLFALVRLLLKMSNRVG